ESGGCRWATASPGAEHEAANREAYEWPAHVDENQRPRICFERGEHGNGRIFNEHESEPADKSDLQTGYGARCFDSPDQPRQCIIDKDRCDNCGQVSGEIMCPLDVGHRPGVIIEPHFAKDRVPAPADQEINRDQNPNGKMINLVVHKNFSRSFGTQTWKSMFREIRVIRGQCHLNKYKAWKAGTRS